MRKSWNRIIDWLSSWKRFAALLVAIFVLRGLFVLSVLPPFEGWDEYQHIAYVEYVLEYGKPPILNESEVPRSLYPDLVRYPQSAPGADQIRRLGALSYEQFWNATERPTLSPDAPAIPLYQGQHASLYFRCVAPLYAALKASSGLLAAVTGLRLVNLSFGAGAVAIALWGLGRIMKPGAGRYIVGLLIVTQPLFLMNCTRVANDAMAVFFGTLVIVLMLLPLNRHAVPAAIVAGLALGLGSLAKTTTLGLAPFVLFAFAHAVWKKFATLKQAIVRGAIVFGIAAVITFPYFQFNLQHFGMLSPMQEAVKNRNAGLGTPDLIRAACEIKWLKLLQSRYLRHSLWSSGWSLHGPSWRFFGVDRPLIKAHEYLIWFAAIGGLFLLSRKRRDARRLFEQPGTGPEIALLWASVTAALSFHALHTYLALPNVATNSWYAAVIFPWMLALFVQGLAGFPWRVAMHAAAGLMVLVFVMTEVYGVMVDMVRTVTCESWGPSARERLAFMHSSGLGPNLTLPAIIMVICGLVLGGAVWIRAAMREGVKDATYKAHEIRS